MVMTKVVNYWKPEEDEILCILWPHREFTTEDISKILNRPVSSVKTRTLVIQLPGRLGYRRGDTTGSLESKIKKFANDKVSDFYYKRQKPEPRAILRRRCSFTATVLDESGK